MEGPSVTLHTDGQEYNQILWKFGPQNWFIARCNIRDTPLCEITDETSLTHMNLSPEQAELYKRIINSFRDRLKLDNNGSLTINNISDEHAGLYTLQIFNKSNKVDTSTFNVSISSPKIVNDSKCSECVRQCSVMNVTQVTLSWNISSTAPFLEVEYQDTNGNSCEVNSSITDLTKQDCQCMSPRSDSDLWFFKDNLTVTDPLFPWTPYPKILLFSSPALTSLVSSSSSRITCTWTLLSEPS